MKGTKMRFDIKFDKLPGGYAMTAGRSGEQVQVSMRDFVSSEDGDKLILYLEGVSDLILSRLPVRVMPSVIDHLLAIIKLEKTATVYINELEFTG
jgi:hypothetical protein